MVSCGLFGRLIFLEHLSLVTIEVRGNHKYTSEKNIDSWLKEAHYLAINLVKKLWDDKILVVH